MTGAPPFGSPVNKRVPRTYPICTVLEVHDGDSVRVFVDQGFGSWQREWIRLKGVNAKELHEESGSEAKALLIKVLNDNAPDGYFSLRTYWSEGRYKEIREERTFIRYVGDLYAGEVSINEVIASMIQGTEMEGGL